MMPADEYRIEFSIQRQQPGEDDFAEIGFGSSGSCSDPESAVYAVSSAVQNGEWETVSGMPPPEIVLAVIRKARAARVDAT